MHAGALNVAVLLVLFACARSVHGTTCLYNNLDSLPNGYRTWTKIFAQDTANVPPSSNLAPERYFKSLGEVGLRNPTDPSQPTYSILGSLGSDHSFSVSGEFHFRLSYPGDAVVYKGSGKIGEQSDALKDNYNEWCQTSDPYTDKIVQGYRPVSIAWTGAHWGGLAKDRTVLPFIDGSTDLVSCNAQTTSVCENYWYAIGAKEQYYGGQRAGDGLILGPILGDESGFLVTRVELEALQWGCNAGYYSDDDGNTCAECPDGFTCAGGAADKHFIPLGIGPCEYNNIDDDSTSGLANGYRSWTKIFAQDTANVPPSSNLAPERYFKSLGEVGLRNPTDPSQPTYSILGSLGSDHSFSVSGEFHFRLSYPGDAVVYKGSGKIGEQSDALKDNYNEWCQTSDPYTDKIVQGYRPVSIAWTGAHWGGLAKDRTVLPFIDGSTDLVSCNAQTTSVCENYWYAIGAKEQYYGGQRAGDGLILGPILGDESGFLVTRVELEALQWGCNAGYYSDDDGNTCAECPGGSFCTGGTHEETTCAADEGYYCPAGSDEASDANEECPGGFYCAGGGSDKVACECSEGLYCPPIFTPIEDFEDANPARRAYQGNPLDGIPCPPGSYCAGDTAQPVTLAPVCDMVRACGAITVANETCSVRQSTFFKWNDPPVWHATDASGETCMKTADAIADPNPQWLAVDLGVLRLIGTVRFTSFGLPSHFTVKVSESPAGTGVNGDGEPALNPTVGGALPSSSESCAVESAGDGVFEAYCPAATKGRYVFVSRAAAHEELQVCELAVFGHRCEAAAAPAEVVCPMGEEPSSCESCGGCVPCAEGSYSDKEGGYACTACPGLTKHLARPYSPAGSTSVFQCEGAAILDGTSTLEVEKVGFNTASDAWEIEIAFEVGPRIQINGLSTIFLSQGGDASPANDNTFQSKNFPCRADVSRDAGADRSASLEETVCCLQDMRQGYLMTKIFRDFTDGLDLVAANDNCDAEDGSNMLVNADLDVVGEGTIMVDTAGSSYANPIKVEPLSGGDAGDGTYTGVQRAKITISDAELYKISKSLNSDGNLTDSRELFIGLLDLLPTGTRVVDSASQQIKVVLTRTQYGTFAAYGEQNIDYDFISFLNARVHTVMDQSIGTRRGSYGDQYYAEVTFVYDDRLQPVNATGAVELDTVTVTIVDDESVSPCDEELSSAFKAVVADQTCAPQELAWTTEVCPQVSIPDDHFGRLYIPLPDDLTTDVIRIEFDLWFKDMGGRSDKIKLAMDLVVEDFVTWCDAEEGSVDLTENVAPSMIIGTESRNPPRLDNFDYAAGSPPFDTAAETLQDGLITMVLEIAKDKENLEIFFEDVLVVQVNPGSSPSADDLKDEEKFIPTYKYHPDSRDASLILPEELNASCPEATISESFFGCVHKHVVKEEAITNKEWAYLVGSDPVPGTGAQDFLQTMLGSGTAAVAARELGRDYEQYLMGADKKVGSATKIGLWINPGHVWGQTVHSSQYSLSQHVIVYVLYGVKSGVGGGVTRRLLQATPSGASMVTKTLKYEVSAATLVESVMGNAIAIEVEARLPVSNEEACMPLASLRELCSERLAAAVAPHASKVERVECVSVQVENANCDGTRRAASAPVAVVDAVVALTESTDAFLDIDAVVASGSVLAMKQTSGKTFPSAEGETLAPKGEVEGVSDKASGSGSSTAIIGAAAGAAAGVVLVVFGAWKASKKCCAPAEPLTEVVSTGVMEPVSEKARIENLLFDQERQ